MIDITEFALGMITGMSLVGIIAVQSNMFGVITCVVAGGFALSLFARRASRQETK